MEFFKFISDALKKSAEPVANHVTERLSTGVFPAFCVSWLACNAKFTLAAISDTPIRSKLSLLNDFYTQGEASLRFWWYPLGLSLLWVLGSPLGQLTIDAWKQIVLNFNASVNLKLRRKKPVSQDRVAEIYQDASIETAAAEERYKGATATIEVLQASLKAIRERMRRGGTHRDLELLAWRYSHKDPRFAEHIRGTMNFDIHNEDTYPTLYWAMSDEIFDFVQKVLNEALRDNRRHLSIEWINSIDAVAINKSGSSPTEILWMMCAFCLVSEDYYSSEPSFMLLESRLSEKWIHASNRKDFFSPQVRAMLFSQSHNSSA